jgi:hypothetical protein
MLLDISLGGNGLNLLDMRLNDFWSAGNTSAYVCDGVRLDSVQVRKDHYPGRYELTVTSTIQPEVPGRTIRMTAAIVSDGQELQRQTLSFKIRGVRNTDKEFHFQFTEDELTSLFDRGRAPLLRIILDVR